MSSTDCSPCDATIAFSEDDPLTLSAGNTITRRRAGAWWWGALIVVVGVLDAWGSRYNLNPDGISYIEMAQHAVAGVPDGFINGYWSPGYPMLVAPVMAIMGHDWVTVIPALHLANLLIFVVTAGLGVRLFRATSAPGLSRYAIGFGTAASVVIAIECIGLGLMTPDFGVMFVVLATAWCCLQLETSARSWRWAVALGLVLAMGYWLKGIMLPLNGLLLMALFVVPPRTDRARMKLGIAAGVFAIVSLPLMVLVSARVGRVTMGEVGRLNYAWEIDEVTPFVGWVGDSTTRFGAPAHPPQVVQAQPQTLTFASPIRATYALWFDPSYWYAGVAPHFDATGQWRVLRHGLHDLASLAHVLWVVIAGVIVLWLASVRRIEPEPRSRALTVLACWSVAAALVYALVHVESRYLAGFVVIGLVAVWSRLSRRAPRPAMSWLMAAVVIALLMSLGKNVAENTGGFQAEYRPDYLLDAGKLHDAGIARGDRLAMVGDAFEAYAAFGAHALITAQVMDSTGYWQLSAAGRSALQGRLAATGVSAVLANNVGAEMVAEGWRILMRPDSSNMGVLLLRRPE